MTNPVEKLSPRTLRLGFSLITLVVFVLCMFNALNILYLNAISNDQCAWRQIPDRPHALLITDIVPGGVADVAGLKNGDILLKIEGREFATSRTDTSRPDPMSLVNKLQKGDYAVYLIERDGKQLEIKVMMLKLFNIVYFPNIVFGLVFLIVGYIVFMTKPKGKTQRLFGYYSVSLMLALGLSPIDPAIKEISPYLNYIYLSFAFIVRVFGPALFLYFFDFFPVYKKSRYSVLTLSLIIIVNLVASILLLAITWETPGGIILTSFINLPFFFLIAGIVKFYYRARKLVAPDRRKPLRPIMIFSVITLLSYAYTIYVNATNPYLIFLNQIYYLPSLLIITLPLSFGYSIFRYRLMDTDLVIKKSIIYAVVTAVIAALYILLVFGMGNLIGGILGSTRGETLGIIALVIIAFVFDPLKRVTQEWVDKVFYQERLNYQNILLEFSKKLPSQIELKRILSSVIDTVSSAMHIEKVAVVLFNEKGESVCSTKNISDEYCRFNGSAFGLRNLLESTKEPQPISILKEEYYSRNIDQREYDQLVNSGVQLSVPMLLQDKLLGFINVGKKTSEKVYCQDDINLLMTVASQTAIAVENARLHEKEKTLYHINEEMKVASRIQLEWLPKAPPIISSYDIAGKTFPAKVVGGDYFDFIQAAPKKLAVCIGDVSGKGLPAALLMANLQAIIRSQSSLTSNPRDCLRQTNEILFNSSGSDMFVTFCYGILSTSDNTFSYSNAGHNYPVLFKRSGGMQMLSIGGLILGVRPDSAYEQGVVKLEQGDLLVMYSDGITEEFNSGGKMFGEDRLYQILEAYRHDTAQTIVDNVMQSVRDFSGSDSQRDDMTMVVIKKL